MLKFICKLLLLFLFITTFPKTFAQYEFTLSGYAVDTPVYTFSSDKTPTFFPKENQLLNLTRLRLKPQIFLWSNARINIEYEMDALLAKNINNSELNQVTKNQQLINMKWDIASGNKYKLSHYIDRLYFRQGFDWGNIIAGRQRISWGTGRIWNP